MFLYLIGNGCRIFRYPISQEQLVYLEVVLDPAGDLPLSLDELLLGIRQSQVWVIC
jgi:hypothetical protein